MELSETPERIRRDESFFLYRKAEGASFPEIAPVAWSELRPLLAGVDQTNKVGVLGLSGVDPRGEKPKMLYLAGVAFPESPRMVPDGLELRTIPAGHYAKFTLKGPYDRIGEAFETIFETLYELKTPIRPEYCIENYVNDPATVAPEELVTELLVPVK